MLIKAKKTLVVLVALLYSILFVYGRNILENDAGDYKNLDNILKVLVAFFVILIVCGCFILVLKILKEKNLLNGFEIKYGERYLGWIVFSIIIVAWAPIYITCFPGLHIYDGGIQAASWTRHHPIFHTSLIKFCVIVSEQCKYIEWEYIYCLTQLIIMALIFSNIILKLLKMGVAKIYIILVVIFICFYPMNALMAIATTKDTLFSGFFVLWLLEYYELVSDEMVLLNGKTMWKYIILSFLVCGFRKNGIYVLAFVSIISLFILKKVRVRFAIISLGVVVLFALFEGPFLTKLGLPKGDFREALSAVIQPLSRAYNTTTIRENMTEQDIEAIKELFGGDEPWCISHISDPPKSQFRTETFKSNLGYYIRLFLRIGITYPTVYLDAWAGLTYGNWFPFDEFPDKSCYRFYFEFPEENPNEYGTKCESLYLFLQDFSRNNTTEKYGIITCLFSSGMAFWIMLAELAYGIYRKNKYIIMLLVAMLALWGTIMLGPVALFRYSYPLIVANIVSCGIIIKDYSSATEK